MYPLDYLRPSLPRPAIHIADRAPLRRCARFPAFFLSDINLRTIFFRFISVHASLSSSVLLNVRVDLLISCVEDRLLSYLFWCVCV